MSFSYDRRWYNVCDIQTLWWDLVRLAFIAENRVPGVIQSTMYAWQPFLFL
jgi:hypothetical protein